MQTIYLLGIIHLVFYLSVVNSFSINSLFRTFPWYLYTCNKYPIIAVKIYNIVFWWFCFKNFIF